MLKLSNITKVYVMGDKKDALKINALRGIDLEFRKSDFVSILGPSGCGKTTLLNIIGGLDRYTSGDLNINGVSTKAYKDVDWDIYRNNSIGFVFQNYNLIPHQTVFANVELAMTLAGKSHEERRKRVLDVLERVGLGDQVDKRPTQISGGQMQRVAIARALVNNPDILLADEPTGALDSETSVQIMELLKEIAKDRLVIMVTHNPELAERFSTRIIRLLDGSVVDDSNPYKGEPESAELGKRKKISMSFSTALSLSLKNLLTKKTRTLLTAFAGSIGIIGIALILSLSSGMQTNIDNLERDTLSTYPLQITSQTMDMTGMMSVLMENNREERTEERLPDRVYANNIMTGLMESATASIQKNDLKHFMEFIESPEGQGFYEAATTIDYGYNLDLQIYKSDMSNGIVQVNPSNLYDSLGMGEMGDMNAQAMDTGIPMSMGMGFNATEMWTQMLDNPELLEAQYDVLAGRWPENYNEVVLVVSDDNELSDFALYSLGFLDSAELEGLVEKAVRGEVIEDIRSFESYSFDELLDTSFKLALSTDYYVKEGERWVDMRYDDEFMTDLLENAVELKITGIIRPTEGVAATSISGSVGYLPALQNYVMETVRESEIAKEQEANPNINVFTGVSFDMNNLLENLTMDDIDSVLAELPEEQAAQARMMLSLMPEDVALNMFAEQFASRAGNMNLATYEDNRNTLGIVDFDTPSTVSIYPKDFESKKDLETLITGYNEAQEQAGSEEYIINYTDIVGLMTSSISDMIDVVSYVLIAFVAISLVVSSIMIAIITYISVLERTKEIGILRSIGASKKDITRVFNAETVIEGFGAGALGVLITFLLNFPINAIVEYLTDIPNLSVLPLYGAVGLILISVLLTVIAGLIPSRMAAKKDPVEALRSE